MRICSFLPSATEILYELGVGDSVSGVTFECDFPPEAAEKPFVVHTLMPSGLTPQQIDDFVREQAAAGGSLYVVNQEALEAIQPDLVLTQDLCRVCAIGTLDLAAVLRQLPVYPQVLSLEPHTLGDVFSDIQKVAQAIDREAQGTELLATLQARLATVAERAADQAIQRGDQKRPRVLCLEWLAPFYQGGHWVPDMVALAGGDAVLAAPGERSVRMDWEQISHADPEILVIMPCGFHLAETVSQYAETEFPEGWANLAAVRSGQVYAVDGTAYFSRPGPRLVTGVEILQAILEDAASAAATAFRDLPRGSVVKLG